MKNSGAKRLLFLIVLVSIMLAVLLSVFNTTIIALAKTPDYYTVYTQDGEELCTRGEEEVEVGESYISYNNKKYEIVEVDKISKKCKAKYVEDVKMPDMSINGIMASSLILLDKSAALYITHNDESYIPTDGTESIYGAGGIHDVAKAFADALRNEGFIVTLDETLHLPHDNSAYRRSRTTADKLIKENDPDVIFDIHRDGAPRRIYDTVVGGEPMSKVRIVVGKGNESFDDNYQFALEIKALADEWYPGLIADVYMGAGDYNQDLLGQGLLLEFGSEEIEKELALKSVVPMATVINGVLQRRAVQASYTRPANNVNLFLNIQNGTAGNSAIFNLLLLVGVFVILFSVLILINKKIRSWTSNFFTSIGKGLFFTRKY
jgi:stage II sporulation protein P